jgi:hypothetical protein
VKGLHSALGPGLFIVVIAALPRIVAATRQDLWADELFSLAVATGHSLEHPASSAVPALGDFVEPGDAVPAASFQRYLEHESPPAGTRRVLRAVLLSDTSPPLYYVLLNGWTRLLGTGDAALHWYSVLWSLATLPWLWLVARRLGGAREAVFACTLFALAPISLYYSVEGRMYAMTWCLSTVTAWLTLRLHDRGGGGALALWTAVSAAGLLTHYFYAFVWAACLGWLVVRPGQCRRRELAGAAAVAALLVAPWYRLVPAGLGQWRVTGHWLDGRPAPMRLLAAPLTLGWGYLSGRGPWGGLRGADLIVAMVSLAAAFAWVRRDRRAVLSDDRVLLWLWAIAACTGPVLFDLLRDTSTSQIARYALAGLPAGLILAALAIAALPRRAGLAAIVLLLVAWAPGIWVTMRRGARSWEPYRRVAAELRRSARPGDVVLVHGIPSGVLGIARYLDPATPMTSWVGQLGGRRVPEDVARLLSRHARIALVRIHDVGEPAPEEAWLRAHATVAAEDDRAGAPIVYFAGPSTRR